MSNATDSAKGVEVLVVEDEEAYITALEGGLEREGFRVRIARSGPEALQLFDESRPDVVLLDLMLPGLSGVDVCRQIRTKATTPVIMVTAKDSEVDTVVGLEVGADDYVVKPYRLRELVARIRAVLRRSAEADAVARGGDSDEVLAIGDVRLDLARHSLQVRGNEVPLTLKEFELLEALMTNAGRALSRSSLIDSVWAYDDIGESKTVDVHIMRLRAKIEEDPAAPVYIATIRGLGYRFEKLPEQRSVNAGNA